MSVDLGGRGHRRRNRYQPLGERRPVQMVPVRRGASGQGQRGKAYDALTPLQEQVLSVLDDEPLRPSAIAAMCGMSRNSVAGVLLALQAKDRAERSNLDGRWTRKERS